MDRNGEIEFVLRIRSQEKTFSQTRKNKYVCYYFFVFYLDAHRDGAIFSTGLPRGTNSNFEEILRGLKKIPKILRSLIIFQIG